MALGANASLRIKLGTATPAAGDELNGAGSGLTSLQTQYPQGTSTLGGGGNAQLVEGTGDRSGTATLTARDTTLMRGLWWGQDLRRVSVDDAPEGRTSGKRRYQYQAIATPTLTIPASGARTWSVVLAVDGAITETTIR